MRHSPGAPTTWGFAAPALILAVAWWVLPALATAGVALVPDGLDTLRWLLGDGGVREAARNTVVWILGVGIGSTIAGLGLAALADRLRDRGVLLTVVLLPTVLAPAVVAVMWRLVLAFRPAGTSQVGLLNQLWSVGLDPRAWLTQVPVNSVLLAGALVWVQTGVAMLVLSTAVARVPGSVRDAARVDGATELQVFGRITVPSIRGAVILAGLSSAAVAIRVFDLVQVATGGQHATSVLGTEMFDQAFVQNEASRGAALALVMLVLATPLAVVAIRRLWHREALR